MSFAGFLSFFGLLAMAPGILLTFKSSDAHRERGTALILAGGIFLLTGALHAIADAIRSRTEETT